MNHDKTDRVPVTLISGGALVLALLLIFDLLNNPLRPSGFEQPTQVQATVTDTGERKEGGRATCQPTFRFTLDGQLHTQKLPVSTPRSCYPPGRLVPITVDAADPARLTDPGNAQHRNDAWAGGLMLGGGLLITGLAMWWRRRAEPPPTARLARRGREQ